jgi:parvulin-like peptidyl-prolyl isomerase
MAEALSAAGSGQLVGQVETPHGYILVLVEACRPPALDAATRRQIENELFTAWLGERTCAVRIMA